MRLSAGTVGIVFGPRFTRTSAAGAEPWYEVVPVAEMAINAGLRALGVRAEPPFDEYATVGLDRHRYTDDWLEQ